MMMENDTKISLNSYKLRREGLKVIQRFLSRRKDEKDFFFKFRHFSRLCECYQNDSVLWFVVIITIIMMKRIRS